MPNIERDHRNIAALQSQYTCMSNMYVGRTQSCWISTRKRRWRCHLVALMSSWTMDGIFGKFVWTINKSIEFYPSPNSWWQDQRTSSTTHLPVWVPNKSLFTPELDVMEKDISSSESPNEGSAVKRKLKKIAPSVFRQNIWLTCGRSESLYLRNRKEVRLLHEVTKLCGKCRVPLHLDYFSLSCQTLTVFYQLIVSYPSFVSNVLRKTLLKMHVTF